MRWYTHVSNVCTKANRTLGFLRRNLHSCPQEVKEAAYKGLVRPVLEYGSSVWDLPCVVLQEELVSVQKRAARFVTGNYKYETGSMNGILGRLKWESLKKRRKDNWNWRTLEQRCIDSRLTVMYKITYDLVAIPAADYLIPNTRQSRHNHQLAYRQIPTLKDSYKFIFFPCTIVHWNALPFYIPVLPTVAQFSHAVCQVVHVSP